MDRLALHLAGIRQKNEFVPNAVLKQFCWEKLLSLGGWVGNTIDHSQELVVYF